MKNMLLHDFLDKIDTLGSIEIYNYLEKISNKFDIERILLIFDDFDAYYSDNSHELSEYKVYKMEEAIRILKEKLTDKDKTANINSTNLVKTKFTEQSVHFTRSFTYAEQKNLFNGLTTGGFLPKTTDYSHFCHVFGGTAIPDYKKTFKPLNWIKSNSTTKGIIPNKRALLDLLCLLNYPDDEIQNRKLLNSLFTFTNGKPLKSQNYTDITDSKGNLKRPIVSEYHSELKRIVGEN